MDKQISWSFSSFSKKYIVEERVDVHGALYYMKVLKQNIPTKIGWLCGISKNYSLKMYVYNNSTLGGDNLLFCGEGFYTPWENKNSSFMVASC